jgi:squalene synthase HpnC
VERPGAGHGEIVSGVSEAADLASGKGHHDENFPVASFLIQPRNRSAIFAFYRFARAADDIADNAQAAPDEKLALLESFRSTLIGGSDAALEASELRDVLKNRNLAPQHALDLLEAFRRDVTVRRYPTWDSLLDYCRYSAMPVGRFVLDVHGESRDTWPANDALCAALQVINHLQDCQKDYWALDRVYLPQDDMAAAGVDVSALDAATASPALRRLLQDLTRRTMTLLAIARPFARQIRDARLALEVTVIQKFAEDLCRKLVRNDPLSQRVHHTKAELVPLLVQSLARFGVTRLTPTRTLSLAEGKR